VKKLLLFISICIISIILGQVGRASFGNVGLADVKNLEDLNKLTFTFGYVEGKEDGELLKQYEDDYVKDAVNSECIFIAKPTGKLRLGQIEGMQEVIIEKVIKGEKNTAGDCVWIDNMPGFEYCDKELFLEGFFGWLMKDQRYLICVSWYTKDCYVTNGNLSCYNMDTSDHGMVVDTESEYTYDQVRQAEFFAGDESVLQEKKKIKERIFKELNLNN
jgi:hypothetical protein